MNSGLNGAMLSCEPPARLSSTTTEAPRAVSASTTCEPMNPRAARDQRSHASEALAVQRNPIRLFHPRLFHFGSESVRDSVINLR